MGGDGDMAEAETVTGRFGRLRQALLAEPVWLDSERALLVTDYFKRHDDPGLPLPVRKARALRHILEHKSATVWPDELIAGNPGSHRISALMQPELASVWMSEDLLWIGRRRTTPLRITLGERARLLREVMPYWATRNLPWRALAGSGRLARYVLEQLRPTCYLINEAGGIGHFIPDYPKMLRLGTEGFLRELQGREEPMYEAMRIALEGLAAYASRLADEAERKAWTEADPGAARGAGGDGPRPAQGPGRPGTDLPRGPAVALAHPPGGIAGEPQLRDFFRADGPVPVPLLPQGYRRRAASPATKPGSCWPASRPRRRSTSSCSPSASASTMAVTWSRRPLSSAASDREGNDAINDLTRLFLDVMEETGLRDPNYQARVHAGSPPDYVRRVAEVARRGNGMPALFFDEAVVSASRGATATRSRRRATTGWWAALSSPCRGRASSPPTRPSSTCPSAWCWP